MGVEEELETMTHAFHSSTEGTFFNRKVLRFFLISLRNHIMRGTSNEYPQHMYSLRNKNHIIWTPFLIWRYRCGFSTPIHDQTFTFENFKHYYYQTFCFIPLLTIHNCNIILALNVFQGNKYIPLQSLNEIKGSTLLEVRKQTNYSKMLLITVFLLNSIRL